MTVTTGEEVLMNRYARTVSASDDGVIRRPETKSFILTSEFWVATGAAAAVLLAGYALDDIAETTAWRYAVWLAIAYIISRGIAKAGSQRDYRPDPSWAMHRIDENENSDSQTSLEPSTQRSEGVRAMPREYHPADS